MSFDEKRYEGDKCLVFLIDEDFYAVKSESVVKLVTGLKITPLPRVPEWFEGVTNFHNEVIPVFDLRKFLKKDNHKGKHFIVVNIEEYLLALRVCLVFDVVSVSGWLEKSTSIVTAEASFRQKRVFLIDLEKLVSLL